MTVNLSGHLVDYFAVADCGMVTGFSSVRCCGAAENARSMMCIDDAAMDYVRGSHCTSYPAWAAASGTGTRTPWSDRSDEVAVSGRPIRYKNGVSGVVMEIVSGKLICHAHRV